MHWNLTNDEIHHDLYTLKMLGKFSWVIVGWLKMITILGNYYPIGTSSDLSWANFNQ